MESRFDDVNGIILHSLEAGKAGNELIIFLHGFPEYSGAWKKQLDFMAQNGYHALAPDLRGYNLSSKPKGVRQYLLKHLTADIAALINKLKARTAIIVGHDWGGAVAWEMAIYYPHLVKQLVILNMPHLAVMKHTLKTQPRQMLRSWYQGFFQIPVLPELLCSSFNYKFLENMILRTANKGTFSKEEMAGYKRAWQQPQAITNMINRYRASKYDDNANQAVDLPVLMLWGLKDIFLEANMAQQSIAKCRNGRLIMFNNATHWLHHEEPDKVNKYILSFLKNE